VDFGDVQHRLRAIDLFKISNDLEDWRLGAVEMQSGHRLKRIAPRRGQEDYQTVICRMLFCSNQILVVTLNKLNRCIEVSDVTFGQIKDDWLDLETDALGSR